MAPLATSGGPMPNFGTPPPEGLGPIDFTWFTPNQGGVDARAAADSTQVTGPVFVPGADWVRAKKVFLGWARLKTDGTHSWISRQLPLAYEDDTDLDGGV